jgi:hypothetical protein
MLRDSSAPWTAFATSRAMLLVTGYLVLTLFPVRPLLDWQVQVFQGHNWIDGWVRWDAMWYEAIVDPTATALPPDHSSANFFPLYSIAASVVGLPFRAWLDAPRAFYAGGLVVSSVACLVGLLGVFRLGSRLVGWEAATRAMWLIAFFPFSFFFTSVYSDALYFCLAAWSFNFAFDGRWRWACALAALAASTRLAGVSLYPALLVEYLRRRDWRVSSLRQETAAWAILALAPLGIGAYFSVRYGSPIAFLHARQEGWARAAGLAALASDLREFLSASPFACASPGDCLREWGMTQALLGYWYVALIPASVVLAVRARRLLGPGLTVWVLVSVAIALPNGLDGMGRFTAVLFPSFLALAALLRNRAAVVAISLTFLPFQLLFFAQFARWRPVL